MNEGRHTFFFSPSRVSDTVPPWRESQASWESQQSHDHGPVRSFQFRAVHLGRSLVFCPSLCLLSFPSASHFLFLLSSSWSPFLFLLPRKDIVWAPGVALFLLRDPDDRERGATRIATFHAAAVELQPLPQCSVSESFPKASRPSEASCRRIYAGAASESRPSGSGRQGS